jgi:hypothetical protein
MKVAVLAQAAKTARIAWAVLVSGKPYQANRLAVARSAVENAGAFPTAATTPSPFC